MEYPAPKHFGKPLSLEIGPTRLFAACACVAFVATAAIRPAPAGAASPQLARIEPVGIQRGTQVAVQLRGNRLADSRELLFYEPGIEASDLKVVKGVVHATLAVEEGCRVGQHGLRIRTASGISNLKTLSIGHLPVVDEKEPNNDFDAPQKVPMDTTIHGVVRNEDLDYYAVEAKKGQRISVEIEGLRLGDTFFDPYVAILDRDRFTLAASDDAPLLHQDAVATVVAPRDGRYLVVVRESAFGGSGNCRYRLHVGRFPRPTGIFPAGGRIGETLEVRYLGDCLGEWTERIALPDVVDSRFAVFAHDAAGTAPSANPFRLSTLENVLEAEPNDAPAEANDFSGSKALNGILERPGDVDCYRFTAKKGQVLHVRVHARSLRSPLDSVLQIRRLGGGSVGSNDDDGGSPDSYLRFQAPADDQYVISIRDHLRQGGDSYFYRIEVSPPQATLTVGLPERPRFADTVAPVPQGNRLAIMTSVQRQGFGGEVSLHLQELPEGISAQTVPIASDRSQVPILLSAGKTAPIEGGLVDLLASHSAKNRAVEGGLLQRTSLVRGRNNREVWNHYTHRMAAAVTEAVPFHVDVVQPKVPLVRSGSTRLKVVASRDNGFDAPITVRMLYNPPGVSAPNSVTIAKGATDVDLPLTANGSAKVRTWPIAVVAQAQVSGGPVMVSSRLIDLEVAEPYVAVKFPTIAVEQGADATLALEVEGKKEFPGKATFEMLGLPNGVTTTPIEAGCEAADVAFPLTTTKNSPPGLHKTLVCRVVVQQDGEPITHMLGRGQLRIQRPAAPVVAKPKPTAPKPKAKATAPKAKPLSRLEQLRQQARASVPATP